ncbi:MAG: DUF6580 family putative transport protein [Chromatiales bacterium]
MFAIRTKTVLVLIALAALARLLPHPPNFTPVLAMALFAGSYVPDRRLALALPIAAMLVTDMVLGWHGTVAYVYGALVAVVGLGMWTASRRSVPTVLGAAIAGSLLFFALTNFGVWATQTLYPATGAGLLACYVAALPFLHISLLGDVLYTVLLFGSMACWERRTTVRRTAT